MLPQKLVWTVSTATSMPKPRPAQSNSCPKSKKAKTRPGSTPSSPIATSNAGSPNGNDQSLVPTGSHAHAYSLGHAHEVQSSLRSFPITIHPTFRTNPPTPAQVIPTTPTHAPRNPPPPPHGARQLT